MLTSTSLVRNFEFFKPSSSTIASSPPSLDLTVSFWNSFWYILLISISQPLRSLFFKSDSQEELRLWRHGPRLEGHAMGVSDWFTVERFPINFCNGSLHFEVKWESQAYEEQRAKITVHDLLWKVSFEAILVVHCYIELDALKTVKCNGSDIFVFRHFEKESSRSRSSDEWWSEHWPEWVDSDDPRRCWDKELRQNHVPRFCACRPSY